MNFKVKEKKIDEVCYVVITYYQLMYSIMHCITSGKRASIYISEDYVQFGDKLHEYLENSDIFENVVFFNTKEYLNLFFAELRKDNPETAFESILESNFNLVFGNIDDKHFYIFNEFQLYFYYVEKYCKSISLIEDGYMSYNIQNSIIKFKGNYTLIDEYIGTFFPKVKGESSKIIEFIVNKKVKHFPSHQGLITIVNFNDMCKKIGKKNLHKIYSQMFDYPKINGKKCALLLTQPLARARYCTRINQLKLYDKICRNLLEYHDYIYIKPHPADTVDYKYLECEKIKLLKSDFPIEVYNYVEVKFSFAYSFGSTANALADYSVHSKTLFKMKDFCFDDVVKFISKYIKNHKLRLLKVLHVDSKVNKESFLDSLKGENKRNRHFTDFDVTTVIVNESDKRFDTRYGEYKSIENALKFNDYNYFLVLKNSVVVPMNVVTGVNNIIKSTSSNIISLFSTLIYSVNGTSRFLELDDTSLLRNIYNKLIARGYAKSGVVDIRGVEPIAKVTHIKNSMFSYYYTERVELDIFFEFIISELKKSDIDTAYRLNLIRMASFYDLDLSEFTFDYNTLKEHLKNKVIIGEIDNASKNKYIQQLLSNKATFKQRVRKRVVSFLRRVKRRLKILIKGK